MSTLSQQMCDHVGTIPVKVGEATAVCRCCSAHLKRSEGAWQIVEIGMVDIEATNAFGESISEIGRRAQRASHAARMRRLKTAKRGRRKQ